MKSSQKTTTDNIVRESPQSPTSPSHLITGDDQAMVKKSFFKDYRPSAYFSFIYFYNAIKLINFFNRQRRKNPRISDLHIINHKNECEELDLLFTKTYKGFRTQGVLPVPSMLKTFFRILKKDFLIQIMWQAPYLAFKIAYVYFSSKTLLSIADLRLSRDTAYQYTGGMWACSLIAFFCLHQYGFNGTYAANKMKVGILAMLFRKIQRLSLQSIQTLQVEKVITLIASDTISLERFSFLATACLMPFGLGGCLAYLYTMWKGACFVGVGYLFLIIFFQLLFSKPTRRMRAEKDILTHKRIRMLISFIENITLIKTYAWELRCKALIEKVRAQEISLQKKLFCIASGTRALLNSSSYVSAILIYIVAYQTGHATLFAYNIFPTVLLLTIIRQICISQSFAGLAFLIELMEGMLRIVHIMELPEVTDSNPPEPPVNPDNAAEFRDYTAFWISRDEDAHPDTNIQVNPNPSPTEKNTGDQNLVTDLEMTEKKLAEEVSAVNHVNLDIKKGSLNVVIGRVASGKSSLLFSFSNEITKRSGEIRFAGTYAYFPQTPLIVPGTIKDSITFGRPYNEEHLWKVLDACCLTETIKGLPEGLNTRVDETGINLSGGNKTLIGLARALYFNVDILLLDDPLSSLDQPLARKVFKRAIKGFLKGRTVILVTNKLNFTEEADKIIVMDKGSVFAQGTFNELTENRTNFTKIINVDQALFDDVADEGGMNPTQMFVRLHQQEIDKESHSSKNLDEPQQEKSVHYFNNFDQEDETNANPEGLDEGLIVEDERLGDGEVTYKTVFKYYWNVFGFFKLIVIVCLFGLSDPIFYFFNQELQTWAKNPRLVYQAYRILIGLSFASLFWLIWKYLLFYTSCISAAERFHNKMLDNILKSSLSFFNQNPIGRIVNRFTYDLGLVERIMPTTILDFLEGFCLFLVTIAALWSQQPWVIVPAAICFVFFLIMTLYCRRAINRTRNLELATRSPIESGFMTCINVLVQLRARSSRDVVMKNFYNRLDENSRASMAYFFVARFFSMVVDFAIEITLLGTFAYALNIRDTPLIKGPFINYILSLSGTMQWILRTFIPLRLLMANMSRIFTYCEHNIDTSFEMPADKNYISQGWPHGGGIEFENVTLKRKHHKEPALNRVSFKIHPGEKVVALGAYGAGLSTLVSAIARTTDVDKNLEEGSVIKIDGVDTSKMGRHLLRKQIAIIPQNPNSFLTSLRDTLDPWREYTDDQLWNVLDKVNLRAYVRGLKEQLDTYVGRGSSVLSVGQKQLLCIGRAMLKKDAKIFIQDQGTVHVDVVTDEQVQRNIEEWFKNSTILTITHRLWTVTHYDRVLVMDHGVVQEFDEPYRLLVNEIGDTEITNRDGAFARLVLKTGGHVPKKILVAAMHNYYLRHKLPLPESASPTKPAHRINDKYFVSIVPTASISNVNLKNHLKHGVSSPALFVEHSPSNLGADNQEESGEKKD